MNKLILLGFLLIVGLILIAVALAGKDKSENRKANFITICIGVAAIVAAFLIWVMGTNPSPSEPTTQTSNPTPTVITPAPTPTPTLIYVTPKPTPTPAPTPTHTESPKNESVYSVQVATSNHLDYCEICVERLQEAGYNAFVHQDSQSGSYLLLIGAFEAKQDAVDLMEYIKQQPTVKGTSSNKPGVTKVSMNADEIAKRKNPWY